jgi:lipopolysaccharide export system permease protein
VNRLDRYLFRQILAPFLVGLMVVTAVVWITQTLQRADILVEYRDGLQSFALISILIIPSLLSVIIPVALFAAALYALQRMHADSEIAVMFAAGVSRLRMSAPFLILALLGAGATLWINVDLMPRSYRVLKQEIASLRSSIASAALRSGEFTPIGHEYTIYVEEAGADGALSGLLVSDYSKRDRPPEIYMAQRGLMQDTELGPSLFLINGNIQRISPENGNVEIVTFERLSINLSSVRQAGGPVPMQFTERYLSELFHPDSNKLWDREHAGALAAEGHARLSSPLYAFAFVLIAIFAMIGGPYQRRGYAARVGAAAAFAGAIRVSGIVLQSLAANNAWVWTLYALPAAAIIGFGAVIFATPSHQKANA